jgi:hypothetical protein
MKSYFKLVNGSGISNEKQKKRLHGVGKKM